MSRREPHGELQSLRYLSDYWQGVHYAGGIRTVCPHGHRTEDAARKCAEKAARVVNVEHDTTPEEFEAGIERLADFLGQKLLP